MVWLSTPSATVTRPRLLPRPTMAAAIFLLSRVCVMERTKLASNLKLVEGKAAAGVGGWSIRFRSHRARDVSPAPSTRLRCGWRARDYRRGRSL